MTPPARIAVLMMAAGKGKRAGSATETAKQYRLLAGKSVLARSLLAFSAHGGIELIQTVIAEGDDDLYETALGSCAVLRKGILANPVHGGSSRQVSVKAGLEALAGKGFQGIVMVHDAARPFADAALIARAIAAAQGSDAAIPVLPVTDTIKTIDHQGQMTGTLPRDGLVNVQTPQVFAFQGLLDAHREAAEAGREGFTDDSAVMEWAGATVTSFAGDPANVKLTTMEDFMGADARLSQTMLTCIGQGYDVHRFREGDHVWIGGVKIPHTHGVEAHSDGDVVLHALTDALLGALAEGDIGVHFSPSDPRWRGASSDLFLDFAAGRVRLRGGRINHLDITLVCEEPRVGPHREAIRQRIAAICGIAVSHVSIKATTSERMGFSGRREGLSASAVATVSLPQETAPWA